MALTIGGVTVPESCYLQFAADISREGAGARTLTIRATGQTAPSLSSVDWAEPVTVSWPAPQTLSALSMTILAPDGISHASDLQFGRHRVSWSLTGVEVDSGASAIVTIGGVDYVASISVSPLGGRLQRKSNGAGLRLQAWAKRSIRIEGEGDAPSVSPGSVSIASGAFTGTMLADGVSISLGRDGKATWTLEGEEE